jgi:hypothetical protein
LLPSLTALALTFRSANDPLLYRERKAYLAGIRNALAGVEEARVALVKVVQRTEG